MTKEQALKLIDQHINLPLNPFNMVQWDVFKLIVMRLTDEAWDEASVIAEGVLAR